MVMVLSPYTYHLAGTMIMAVTNVVVQVMKMTAVYDMVLVVLNALNAAGEDIDFH